MTAGRALQQEPPFAPRPPESGARVVDPGPGHWPLGMSDAHRLDGDESAAFHVLRAMEEHRERVTVARPKRAPGAPLTTEQLTRARPNEWRSHEATKQPDGSPFVHVVDGMRRCSRCRERPAREPLAGKAQWRTCEACASRKSAKMHKGKRGKKA